MLIPLDKSSYLWDQTQAYNTQNWARILKKPNPTGRRPSSTSHSSTFSTSPFPVLPLLNFGLADWVFLFIPLALYLFLASQTTGKKPKPFNFPVGSPILAAHSQGMQHSKAQEPQHLSPKHPAVLPGRVQPCSIWQSGLEFRRKESSPRFACFEQDLSFCHLVTAPAQSCYRIPAGLEAEHREGTGDPITLSSQTFCPFSLSPQDLLQPKAPDPEVPWIQTPPVPRAQHWAQICFPTLPHPLGVPNSPEKALLLFSSSKPSSLGEVQSLSPPEYS